MNHIHVRFIINELSEDEVDELKNEHAIITKMILTPDDYKLFHYRQGDTIEVQTDQGYRMWCTIKHLEVVANDERVILIFTLFHEQKEPT
jgi:hypothetical protein